MKAEYTQPVHAEVDADENEYKIVPLRQKVFNYRERRIRPYKDDRSYLVERFNDCCHGNGR